VKRPKSEYLGNLCLAVKSVASTAISELARRSEAHGLTSAAAINAESARQKQSHADQMREFMGRWCFQGNTDHSFQEPMTEGWMHLPVFPEGRGKVLVAGIFTNRSTRKGLIISLIGKL